MTSLRQRMLEDMQIRNLSSSTQRAYVEHVARFARHFGRSPAALGPEEIRAYQIYLTNDRQLAPASITITVAALRFLYKVTLRKAWAVIGRCLPRSRSKGRGRRQNDCDDGKKGERRTVERIVSV